MTDHHDARITLPMVWDRLEEMRGTLSKVDTNMQLQRRDIQSVVEENRALRVRLGKLESRFNSVLVGIGGGIATAIIVYFRGVTAP